MLALVALAVVSQPKTYDLQLRWKVGDSFVVQMVREFSDPEDEFDLSQTDLLKFKVISLEDEKYTLGIVRTAVEQKMDGKTLPLDPKAEPAILRDIRQKNGALIWTKPVLVDPQAEMRLWRLGVVAFPDVPVKLGQVWSVDWKDLDPLKLPSSHSKYRLFEVNETKQTAMIWIDFEELSTANPISASGRAVVDLKTGWPIEEYMTVKNALVPGGDGKGIKLELQMKTQK